ncbi:shikimate kinase [Campylobacter sp. MG1]|uniref:shikimate kinase n=1 Tax=Campylobacter sp. MG1 TaxID=2976332 RepID=UPI00226CFF59|nr:shikimate kinase [Campylobacter sp. MG1]
MKNIVLIGFMGCGKSTTAKKLAKLTKKQVIDTDKEIEKRCNKSIKEIFAEFGEEYFRKLECDLRDELATKSDLIISCGGGFANLKDIKKMGFVVFLDLSFYKIAARLKNDTKRPLFDEKAKLLYDKRMPLYNNSCDIKLKITNFKAREIVKILEIFLGDISLNKARKNHIKPKISF